MTPVPFSCVPQDRVQFSGVRVSTPFDAGRPEPDQLDVARRRRREDVAAPAFFTSTAPPTASLVPRLMKAVTPRGKLCDLGKDRARREWRCCSWRTSAEVHFAAQETPTPRLSPITAYSRQRGGGKRAGERGAKCETAKQHDRRPKNLRQALGTVCMVNASLRAAASFIARQPSLPPPAGQSPRSTGRRRFPARRN